MENMIQQSYPVEKLLHLAPSIVPLTEPLTLRSELNTCVREEEEDTAYIDKLRLILKIYQPPNDNFRHRKNLPFSFHEVVA